MQRGGGDWPALWFAQDAAARLVVARDLTVLAANRHAVELIEATGLINLRDGALATRDRRSWGDLTTIVGEARAKPHFGVVGSGGGALLVDALALGDTPESPVALLLRDLRVSVEIECADLESMFGVTPGEHQVIVQLVKGYSSGEIAQEFGKSILTVRTHVKRAYGKIGVKTRGQLFAKLLPYLSIR
ncbi:MAG TPA: LuxR C-terminal-related transcriptional regulator [Caulobacteraceae bacterium]